MVHIWLSRFTHVNESCHTREWAVTHRWMIHVDAKISQISHTHESCLNDKWVILHMRMRNSTHMNESSFRRICAIWCVVCVRVCVSECVCVCVFVSVWQEGDAEFARSLKYVRPGTNFEFLGELFATSQVCTSHVFANMCAWCEVWVYQ